MITLLTLVIISLTVLIQSQHSKSFFTHLRSRDLFMTGKGLSLTQLKNGPPMFSKLSREENHKPRFPVLTSNKIDNEFS